MSENYWLDYTSAYGEIGSFHICVGGDKQSLYVGCQRFTKSRAKKALLVLSTYLNIEMKGQPETLPHSVLFRYGELCGYSIHKYGRGGLWFVSSSWLLQYYISKKEVVKLHGILADFLGYEVVEELK